MAPKVFNIGFPKTGTMSIGKALEILGYRVCPHLTVNGRGRIQIPLPVTVEKLGAACIPIAREYDAFRNFPWTVVYREIDKAYPGSKFILTRRDPEAWIESLVRHFGDKSTALSKLLYGPDRPARGNEALYVAGYLRHNEEVAAHFKDRPGDLLVVDLEHADWEALCRFLGRSEPLLRAFPHRNRGDLREEKAGRVRKLAAYRGQEIVRALTRLFERRFR